MKIDITSLCFGFKIKKENDSGTAAWATSIGQAPKDICYIDTERDGLGEIVYGMMYKSHSDFENLKVRDVAGLDKREEPRGDRERMMFSVFEDVYVNNKKVEGIYTLSFEREDSSSHKNRLHICYAKYLTYKGHSNKETLKEMARVLGCSEDACWFVSDISIKRQSCLHFTAIVVNPTESMTYEDSKARKQEWESLVPDMDNSSYDNIALQQIFYGAPGTGKSHTIKDKTAIAEKEERVYRTTFHPDSDYSTFVGCYKPSMKSRDRIYSAEELAVKLKEIKNSGVTYPCHKFAAQYWRSLKDLSADVIKQILNACGFTESMNVEISKGVAIGQEYLNKDEDGKIIYAFTPQAFVNAYVKAWNSDEDVYLIIEEINRGNCAQIFGDLFQLLDRGDDDCSKYPIIADSDLARYLSIELAGSTHKDITPDVRDGKKLVLPSNLYIWATMNTSDQSLFPIDSAFKRRWDWKYLPIEDAGKKWKIKVNGNEYDWYQFLETINKEVLTLTHSEDKQLGYFFAKANNDGIIDAEKLVNKVYFYLWTDVFKDYEYESQKAFRKPNSNDPIAFKNFFEDLQNGEKVNERMAEQVLINLELEKLNKPQNLFE